MFRGYLWREARRVRSAGFKERRYGQYGNAVPNNVTCAQMAEVTFVGQGVLACSVNGFIWALIGFGAAIRQHLVGSDTRKKTRRALLHDPSGTRGLLDDGKCGRGVMRALNLIDALAKGLGIYDVQASTADPAAADGDGNTIQEADANPAGANDGAAEEDLEADAADQVTANADSQGDGQAPNASSEEAPNGAADDEDATGAVATDESHEAESATADATGQLVGADNAP